MAYLNFEEIKATYTIEQVAVALGLELEERGNQLRGKCPVGNGDERSFVITPSKGLFFSFSEQKGGDLISLVSFVKETSAKDAARWIVDTLGKEETLPEDQEPTEQGKSVGFKGLDYLQHDHPAVQTLGFDPDDAERLGIGFCPKGIMKGTVAVPVRLANGALCGYVGITDARLPKKWSWGD